MRGCRARSADGVQHPIQVRHHIGIAEADHAIAHSFLRGRSLRIARLIGVGAAVNRDDDFVRAGAEIGDVSADRWRPREPDTDKTTASRQRRVAGSVISRRILRAQSRMSGPVCTAHDHRQRVRQPLADPLSTGERASGSSGPLPTGQGVGGGGGVSPIPRPDQNDRPIAVFTPGNALTAASMSASTGWSTLSSSTASPPA